MFLAPTPVIPPTARCASFVEIILAAATAAAPTSGNASSIDSYTYVIIKTGSAAFTVLAAQTKFA